MSFDIAGSLMSQWAAGAQASADIAKLKAEIEVVQALQAPAMQEKARNDAADRYLKMAPLIDAQRVSTQKAADQLSKAHTASLPTDSFQAIFDSESARLAKMLLMD
jgi:hypothetical protein